MRGQLTQEMVGVCKTVKVPVKNIDPRVFDRIQEAAVERQDLAENDMIRFIFNKLKDERFIQQHLSVFFEKSQGRISAIVHHMHIGNGEPHRPRTLTRAQEDGVLEFIRDCQASQHCVTASEVTTFINEELLLGEYKVSRNYVSMNAYFKQFIRFGSPQPVEEARIQACYYDNFKAFFEMWGQALGEREYDPDLIINMDETTANAEKCKRTTQVLYDPAMNIRPMATVAGKMEHVTVVAAITASGKHLLPVFIIGNSTILDEDGLCGPDFNCGDYGIGSSPNGWQDSVSIY